MTEKLKPLTKKDVDYYTKVNKKHYYVEVPNVLSAKEWFLAQLKINIDLEEIDEDYDKIALLMNEAFNI